MPSPRSALRAATIALALALTPTLTPLSAAAQSTMKLASATINDVQHEWQKVFAAELEARVGDAVTVEIYPASQLGTIPRMAEGVLLGSIEAFTTPTAFMTNVDPRFQAFDVPGLFAGPEDVRAAIHEPAYRDHLETLFLDSGLRVIGAIYNSPTVVLTREPAPHLADLDGLKIRTFASPLQMEPMAALGAIPVPLALSEIVPQLQSGGLDGMLAGMPILTAFKYYDVAKYVTDLKFAEIVSVTVVNEDWFQAQDENVRAAIIEAGRAAETAVFPWGVENVARTNAIWVENGGEILALSEEERLAMVDRFEAVTAEVLADQPEVMAEYERLAELVAKGGGN